VGTVDTIVGQHGDAIRFASPLPSHTRISRCSKSISLTHRRAHSRARKPRRYFNANLDPYASPSTQLTPITLPGPDTPTWLYAYVHMSGVGVRRGFRVSEMDAHLQGFATQIHSNAGRA
jgi:hypothetical protein